LDWIQLPGAGAQTRPTNSIPWIKAPKLGKTPWIFQQKSILHRKPCFLHLFTLNYRAVLIWPGSLSLEPWAK
jgi:hypothetical protein